MRETVVRWGLGLVMLLVGFGSGCASPSIELTADKAELCAGGYDKTDITAKVSLTGGGTKANILVNFTLSGEGSFSTDPAYPLTSTQVATDDEGVAVVTLYAGRNAGTNATITADFTDDESGDYATSNLTIPFVPPQPGCGGAPASSSLSFRCDALNIGAFRTPMPDIAVPCYVEAATHDGSSIPAEAMEISFLLEAGSMETQTGNDGDRFFLYKPSGGTRIAPKQVSPDLDLGEPSRFDSVGQERCPRQGLVTMVALVRGEEGWTDANGNGVFDVGSDTFQDLAEPFLDMNDNGERDADEDYVDLNNDGQWTPENGTWDADTTIWTVTYMLWTGPPAVEQKDGIAATHYELSAQSTTITAPNSLTVSLYLRDDNLNPVAGFDGLGSYDKVDFMTTDSAISPNPVSRPIPNQLGFEFNAAGAIEGNTFLSDQPYRTTLETFEGWTGAYTLNFVVTTSPGHGGGVGWFLPQIVETLTLQISGQVE